MPPIASINPPRSRYVDPRVRRGGAVKLDPSYGSSIVALLWADPDRSGGVGGWTTSERQQQRSATWFQAQPDDTLSLTLAFDRDALPGTRTVEERLIVVREMGVRHDGHSEPPHLRVGGDIWDHDEGIDWVVTNLTLGERLMGPDGYLQRQVFTLDLGRYEPLGEIQAVKVKATRGKHARRRHTVVTRNGDTLRTVSVRELGSPSRWTDLRKWNKSLRKVNPDVRLRTGTRIVIR